MAEIAQGTATSQESSTHSVQSFDYVRLVRAFFFFFFFFFLNALKLRHTHIHIHIHALHAVQTLVMHQYTNVNVAVYTVQALVVRGSRDRRVKGSFRVRAGGWTDDDRGVRPPPGTLPPAGRRSARWPAPPQARCFASQPRWTRCACPPP